jgi:hypothetical protein
MEQHKLKPKIECTKIVAKPKEKRGFKSNRKLEAFSWNFLRLKDGEFGIAFIYS